MPTRLNKELFIEKARAIHGNKYDYSKVEYINNKKPVCIICPEHGEFWQTPHGHLKGYGCNLCGNGIRFTTEEYIHKAHTVHGDKYDYSKCVYIGALKKVCIICPKHGEFWQEASSHIRGCGCPMCDKTMKHTLDSFITSSRKVHGNKYDYSKVEYINNKTKVCIICPEHGEFWQSPKHHLAGNGCPVCKDSKLEQTLREEFIKNEIDFIEKCTSSTLPWLGKQHLDFYIPDYSIAIECQGIQHFKENNFFRTTLEHIQELDMKKLNLCKKHGVKLFYFSDAGISYPYDVYENKNEIIKLIKNGK